MDQAPETNQCQPFFIVGAHRSGTTMLQLMLDQHEKIAVCPETMIFKSLKSVLVSDCIVANWQYEQIIHDLLRRLAIFKDPAREVIETYYQDHPSYTGDVRSLLMDWVKQYLARKDKRFFGEKTPNHAHYLREIAALFPAARIVLLYRNPLDVICSLTQALQSSEVWRHLPLLQVQFEAATMVRRALRNMRRFKDEAPLRYFELDYADLVTQSVEVMTGLCRFLEVDFQEQMLEFQDAALIKGGTHGLELAHAKLKQAVSKQSVNRYTKELDRLSSTLFRSFLQEELKYLPYNFREPLVRLPWKERFQLAWYKLRFKLGLYRWKQWRFRQKSRLRLFFSYLSEV